MVCDQCQVLREETDAKDQIIKELNNKLTKQKLQYKAQVAQLKQSINEDSKFSQIATMAIAFEENENEAAICRRQIEELKQLIAAKDLQLKDHQIKIKNLEDQMNRNDDDLRKTESTPAEEDESEKMNDSQQELKRMYAQMVYKDSRILELNGVIDEKDNVIMDLQESLNEKNEVIRSKLRAVQILQEQMHMAEITLDELMAKSQGLTNTVFDAENEMSQLSSSLHVENPIQSGTDGEITLNSKISRLINHVLSLETRLSGVETFKQQQLQPEKKKKRVTFDLSDIDKQSQIDSLRETVRDSEKLTDALRLDNEKLRAELAEIRTEFVPMDRHRQELESLNFQVGVNFSQAQKLVEQLEESNRDWQNKMLKLKAQNQLRQNELEEQLEIFRNNVGSKIEITKAFVDVEVSVDTTSDELAEIKYRCVSLEESVNRLEKDKDTDRIDRENLLERLKQLEEDYKVVCRDCDFFSRERVDLLDEQSRLRSQLDNCQVKLEVLERSSDDLAKEKERLKEKCYKLETEVSDLEFEMAQVYEENKTLDHENQSLTDIIKELKSTTETLTQTDLDLRNTMESTMRQTLSDLENQWQLKLETQQRDYDKEIGEMKLKAKAYDAKIRSLEKEIKDQEEIVDRTVAERDQLLTKVESLRQHHSVESETFSQRESQLQSELTQMKAKLESVARDNESLSLANSELQQKLLVAESDADYFREELTSATEELRNTKSSANSLGEELAEVKSFKKTLVEEKEDIETELETLWSNESQLKKQLAEVESLNQQLITSCGELQSRCGLLEQEEKENQGKIQRLLGENAKLTKLKLMLTDEIELLKSSSTEQQKSLATDMVKCKEKLGETELQIDELTAQLTKEKTSRSELAEDLRDKLDEIAHLKGKLSDQQFQFEMRLGEKSDVCEQLQRSIAELQATLTSVKNSLNVERTSKSTLENELHHLKSSSSSDVSVLQQEVTKAQENLSHCKTRWTKEVANLSKQLGTIKKEHLELINMALDSRLKIAAELTKASELLAGTVEEKITSTLNNMSRRHTQLLEVSKQQLVAEKFEAVGQLEFLLEQHQKSLDSQRCRQDELLSTIALKDSKLVQLQGEKSELTARLRQLQTENLQLQQAEVHEMSSKTDEIRDLQRQIQQLHGDNKRLLDSLEAILNDKKKLTEERQTLCKEILNLNSALTESNNNQEAQQIAILGLNDSIDNLIKENENLQAALNEQNLKITELSQSQSETDNHSSEKQILEARQQSTALMASINVEQQQADLQSAFEESQKEIQRLLQIKDKLADTVENLNSQITQQQMELKEESHRCLDYKEQVEGSRVQYEELREQQDKWQTETKHTTVVIEELQQKLTIAERNVGELKLQLKSQSESLEQNGIERADFQAEMENKSDRLQNLEEITNSLNSKLQDAQSELLQKSQLIEELQEKLLVAERDTADFKLQIKVQSDLIEQDRMEKAEFIMVLEAELKAERQKNGSSPSQLPIVDSSVSDNQTVAELRKITKEELQLAEELQSVKESLVSSNEEVEKLQTERQAIEDLYHKAVDTVKELESTRDQLQIGYTQLSEYYNSIKESYGQLYEQYQSGMAESTTLKESLIGLEKECEEQKTICVALKNDLLLVAEEKSTAENLTKEIMAELTSLKVANQELAKQLEGKTYDYEKLVISNKSDIQLLMKELQENHISKTELVALQSNEADVDDWKRKCSELVAKLEDSERQCRIDSSALAEEKEVTQALQSELREVKVLLKERTIELQRLEEDEKLLKEQLGIINESLMKMSSECERLGEEIQQAEQTKKEYSAIVDQMKVAKQFESQLADCRIELEKVRTNLNVQQQLVNQLGSTVESKQAEIEQLQDESAAQHTFVEEKSAEIKSCRFLIEELEAGLAYSEEEKTKILADLSDLKQRMNSKSDIQLNEMSSQTEIDLIADLEKKIVEKEEEIKESQQRLMQECNCRVEVEEKFGELTKEKYQLAEELVKVKADLVATVEVRNGAFEKLKAQRVELESLKKETEKKQDTDDIMINLRAEVQTKSDRLKQLEEETRRLEEVTNHSNAQVEAVQTELIQKTKIMEELQIKLSDAESRAIALALQLNEQSNLIEQDRVEKSVFIMALEAELAAEREKTKILSSQLSTVESSVSDNQSVVEELREMNAILTTQNSQLKERLLLLENDSFAAKEVTSKLQAEKQLIEEQFCKATETVQELESTKEHIQLGYTQLTEYYNAIKESYGQLYEQFQTTSGELNSLRLTQSDLENKSEKQQEELEVLRNQIVEEKSAKTIVEKQLAQIQNEFQTWQHSQKDQSAELEAMKQEKSELKRQLDQLSSEHRLLTEQHNQQNQLGARSNQLEQEKSALSERISIMEISLRTAEQQLSSSEAKMAEVKAERDGFEEEFRSVFNELELKEAECKCLREEVGYIRSRSDSLQNSLDLSEDNFKKLTAEKLSVESALKEFERKNAEVTSRWSDLERLVNGGAEAVGIHVEPERKWDVFKTVSRLVESLHEAKIEIEERKRDQLILMSRTEEITRNSANDIEKQMSQEVHIANQQAHEWKGKCGDYQNEIGYLKEIIESLKEDLNSCKTELSQMHKYKVATTETLQRGELVKDELERIKQSYEDLMSNFQSLTSQSENWESLMASLKSDRDQLYTEVQRLKREVEVRQQQLDANEAGQIASVQQQESTNGELISLRRHQVESRQLYEAAKLELDKMKSSMEELLQSKEADMMGLKQENLGLQEKVSGLSRKLNSMELKIVEREVLSERLQQAELQLERLSSEKRELAKQNGQFQDQIRIQMEERRHLKAEHEQMRVKLESVNCLDEKLKFTESQLTMFQARNAELEREAVEQSGRCSQLEKRLTDVIGSSSAVNLELNNRETSVLMPESLESYDFFNRFSLARPTALFGPQHRYLLQRLRALRRLPYFTHLTRLVFVCYVVGLHILAFMSFTR